MTQAVGGCVPRHRSAEAYRTLIPVVLMRRIEENLRVLRRLLR